MSVHLRFSVIVAHDIILVRIYLLKIGKTRLRKIALTLTGASLCESLCESWFLCGLKEHFCFCDLKAFLHVEFAPCSWVH